MSQSTEGPPPDDDFSAMLQRVRTASEDSSDTPPPAHAPAKTKPVLKRDRATLLIVPAVLVGCVLLVLFGFASIATWSVSRFVTQAATGNRTAFTRKRLQQLQRLRSYRVAVDTTVSPLEAGKLLHAISRAGDDELLAWEQPVESTLAALDARTLNQTNPSTLFDPKLDWSVAAFAVARRGFTDEQRSFLNTAARNPTLAAFRRVSRARAADLGGGMWSVPPDSVIGWPELPVIRGTQLRYADIANVAAAALDLEGGRVALAEQRLREVISVGFLFKEGARSPFDESLAAMFIHGGRTSLEAFYRAVGRSAEADRISSQSDPQLPITPYSPIRLSVGELETVLRRRILDTTELTSVRWELLLGPFTYLPCTAKLAWFFGPDARHRAALRDFHDALVRYPSDERRFAMPVRTAIQLLDPPSTRAGPPRVPSEMARAIGRMTRNGQFEKCSALLTW